MSIDSYLEMIQSYDHRVVSEAAAALGKLKDKTYVPHLIAAFDDGGYQAFSKKVGESEGMGAFGTYRGKVVDLAEALWMIGDEKGIEAARRRLEQVISDGESRVNSEGNYFTRDFFTTELFLLKQFENSTPYFDNWEEKIKYKIKGSESKSSGCFIATAALGSPYCHEIMTLYRWRDDVLLKSFFGRVLVKIYYSVSPSIAKRIERSSLARRLVSNWLIKPWCMVVNKLWTENQTDKNRLN